MGRTLPGGVAHLVFCPKQWREIPGADVCVMTTASSSGPDRPSPATTSGGGLVDLLAGVYRHYQGGMYQVLGYGHDANADVLVDLTAADAAGQVMGERMVVVYLSLGYDAHHTGPRFSVRTALDFHFAHMHQRGPREWDECVSGCDDVVSHVQRFTYVGCG